MNSQRHRLETPRNENEEAEPNSHIICYQGLVEFLPFQVTKRNEITLFVAVTEKVACCYLPCCCCHLSNVSLLSSNDVASHRWFFSSMCYCRCWIEAGMKSDNRTRFQKWFTDLLMPYCDWNNLVVFEIG